ncbi:hypothetical protein [Megamonas hypermegale]|uniref:hypothetical protein n=1 Tax=Megamonas hypermegale TaxID=158847 RepID=UPI0026F36A20|nr:hypothetical protein [Megamonas hypermegale]
MKNILILDDNTNRILTITKNKSGLKVSKSLANVLYAQDNGTCTMEFKPIEENKFDILVALLENSTIQAQ